MGVLNLTPDSFSDGGRFVKRDRALQHAISMVASGADILDVGGESTRPGSRKISDNEELDRVIPVISELANNVDVPISVDTRKACVAEEALKNGASIVNDVSGLSCDKKMADTVSRYNSHVILMHMRGVPENMQLCPRYKDVLKDVIKGLRLSIKAALEAGVRRGSIIVDPGIGFGKTVKHNLTLLNNLDKIAALGLPVCVGVSRKAFIGKILNKKDPGQRIFGTLGSCAAAIVRGARILRVHDVREVKELSLVMDSILKEKAVTV